MSEVSQGDGWWQASDLKWYPPEKPPDPAALPPPLDQPPLPSPLDQPPGGGSPRRSRTPIVIMTVITAVAVLILAGVLVHKFAFPTGRKPAQPVAVSALEGLWLSPDQINTAMGITGIRVEATSAGMADQSAMVPDKACLALQGPAQARVYEGSGWSVLRLQALQDTGNKFTHHVDQAVVLFPSAQDATAFFTASAQAWSACASRHYTVLTGRPDEEVWTAGPVSNTNGTLSTTTGTQTSAPIRLTAQRALIVANNVAIDVMTFSRNEPDTMSNSAVNIAQQIYAKVPK
jgi:PknH-like extracellular domain